MRKQDLKAKSLLLAMLLVFTSLPVVGLTGVAFAQDSSEKPAEKLLSADAYTQKIQDYYDSTKDYQAVFVQTYKDLAAGSSTTSKGKVYIKQPGKMRWDYYKGKKREKLYVSDGVDFWAYELAFKQAFKQCLKGSQLKTSLAFLTGSGDLKKEFNIKLHKKATPKKPRLTLTPIEPTSAYKSLEFALDPKTGQVTETVIYDPYGNSNTIKFLKVKTNTDLPDSGFNFTPPKDARILNQDQKCK